MYSRIEQNDCTKRTKLPCFPGDRNCFPFYKLCLYELYNSTPGFLQTCRNGWHLANCSLHVCHQHFKCLSYYCIPYKYVCDGRQDCPLGDDEHRCFQQNCTGLFRCKGTNLCVHYNEFCDNNTDCPNGDDEILCEIPACPPVCTCFMTSLTCVNVSGLIMKKPVPFLSIYMFESNIQPSIIDSLSKMSVPLDCDCVTNRRAPNHCLRAGLFY